MKRLLVVTVLAAAMAMAFAANASAATLKVCPDASKCFTSVQAAIDAATNGDKIKIAAGTYQGSLEINKDIILHGAGTGQTTITADPNQRVISIAAGVSLEIRALTVTGGSLQFIFGLDPDPYPDFVGGGIFVASSSSVTRSAAVKNRTRSP